MCALEWNGSDGHNDHMKRAPLKLPPDTVGVAAAKRDLTRLIDMVLRSGKSFVISRRGKPVVRIVPCEDRIGPVWDAKYTIPDSSPFWAAMKEVQARRKAPGRGTPQF